MVLRIGDVVGQVDEIADIGVEIEVERFINPDKILSTFWRTEGDGSLQNGIEFVLKNPVSAGKLDQRLTALEKYLGTNFTPSDRTGIHIHLNVQTLTPKELVVFLCLYYIFEELIVDTCGENRRGNHFCFRMVDAEDVFFVLHQSLSTSRINYLFNDRIRYAALNLSSLGKYGSLEFRAIQTSYEYRKEILRVANLLLALRNATGKFYDPVDVLAGYSMDKDEFTELVFGNNPFEKEKDRDFKMTRGMRIAQDIAYIRDDWNNGFNWGVR